MNISIHLNAGHTASGNPRRLYLVVDCETGMAIDAVDEGYQGTGALDEAGYGDAVRGPDIVTTPAEYKTLLKWASEHGARAK